MGIEISFCGSRVYGSRDVILWLSRCHFVGLDMSFCGSRDVILWVYRCHYVGLEMSFCGFRDVIL